MLRFLTIHRIMKLKSTGLLLVAAAIILLQSTLAAGQVDSLPKVSPTHSPTSNAYGQPDQSKKITEYTLPPDVYQKARNLRRIYFRYQIIGFVYGLAILWLILRFRIAPKYRAWAEGLSSKRIVQVIVFAPLLILTIDVLELPTGIYRHWRGVRYGLSVQGWLSWFWDWAKGELVTIIIASIVIWIFYAVIRKSPRRWWIYFWIISLPIGLFLVFLQPLIVDPLFHKFEPLAQKNPALASELEMEVRRAGEDIPPERMFWMQASEKTVTLNAYVTGFGSSKRIVVWDTTIEKMGTPQIVYVVGHEMGHYVLQHIHKGLVIGALLMLIGLYVGSRSIGLLLSRWGSGWQIGGLEDLASLPAFVLLFSILAFAANPLVSGISRYMEHQADQYGLEVTHGLTPDSGQAAAQSFQALGEIGLADPDPNPVDVFLFYDHPPIGERIRFCLTYDPWSQGKQPEFVK